MKPDAFGIAFDATPEFAAVFEFIAVPGFVAPASRRLFCFAFEFVAAGPAKRDRAAVAVGLPLTLLS
jgi:hypothetical protein